MPMHTEKTWPLHQIQNHYKTDLRYGHNVFKFFFNQATSLNKIRKKRKILLIRKQLNS